jgi:hypothetical protein
MRNTALSVLLALSASIVTNAQASEIGMGVLMIWPTARSTALAGAITGIADEADATFFNPAGLASQTTAKADIGYGEWLPGIYQGMYYASAAGGAPLRLPFLNGRNAFIAGSLTYLLVGETDIVNERGDYLGRFNVWRGVVSLSAAMGLVKDVDVGLTVKGIHVHLSPEWGREWWFEPEPDDGTGSTWACDVGAHYRPTSNLSLGLSATNIGPGISYANSGEHDPSPTVLRLGGFWTPVENRYIRLNVMPELNKLLVGMFRDTTATFGRMLKWELRDVWKAVGVEATTFNLLSLRLGYMEDLTNQRGGLVYEQEGQTYHYGLGDVLAGRHLGKLKSIGLCWGMGFGTDRLRFDLSSDAAIYDFPTPNWKFQLVSNDIGGLFKRRS